MTTKPLKRYVLPSEEHSFVGRIYDLSIVSLHFESYDEVLKHPDAKYALDVNYALSTLTRRVESLNMAGDMLWPKYMPDHFGQFPLSRYEWLTVSADVFLSRATNGVLVTMSAPMTGDITARYHPFDVKFLGLMNDPLEGRSN